MACGARSGGRILGMATRKVDALVLDACLRQSLVCMRSLGAAGLTVGAADARRSPAASSRWCSAASILPSVTSPHDFLRAVRAAIERFEPRAVITSHDGSIDVLRPHRKTLGAPLALADEPALALAGSKAQTYALADQIGVRRPAGASVTSAEELTPALAELPPPIVVKPDTSWLPGQTGGRRARAVLATDAEEARRVARGLLDNGAGVVLLQEWIGGRREAVSLLRAGGEVHMRFAQVAFRMAPPLGGSSVLRESIELPADAVDAAEQLADAIDLEGYSEVEFRRARAGATGLMEVNARLSA